MVSVLLRSLNCDTSAIDPNDRLTPMRMLCPLLQCSRLNHAPPWSPLPRSPRPSSLLQGWQMLRRWCHSGNHLHPHVSSCHKSWHDCNDWLDCSCITSINRNHCCIALLFMLGQLTDTLSCSQASLSSACLDRPLPWFCMERQLHRYVSLARPLPVPLSSRFCLYFALTPSFSLLSQLSPASSPWLPPFWCKVSSSCPPLCSRCTRSVSMPSARPSTERLTTTSAMRSRLLSRTSTASMTTTTTATARCVFNGVTKPLIVHCHHVQCNVWPCLHMCHTPSEHLNEPTTSGIIVI